jgi:HPt (histidine-containing phosphotransfer) domain-containing protein
MFGDDLALFKSLLARVLREFAYLTLPISIACDDSVNRGELMARAHKLRGSAGVIGATKVRRLAGEAEEALEECRAWDFVVGIFGQLALALTTLREEADVLLQGQPEPRADQNREAENSPHIGALEIDELCGLLESQNLAAIDKFGSLSSSLSERVGAVRFDRLRNAIENLDFELGAELLRQAHLPAGCSAI